MTEMGRSVTEMSRYIDFDYVKSKKRLDLKSMHHSVWMQDIYFAPSIDIVRCAECLWARPRTLKGETGYRCVFYRVDKAEDGYCDNGEREGE